MKKIQVLAILMIAVLVLTGLKNGIEGAIDGWNSTDGKHHSGLFAVEVAVKADESLAADSLFNSVVGQNIPYRISALKTKVQESPWNLILNVLIFPVALAGLYGLFCVVKLVVSVTRRKVFTRTNVYRMRVFIYSLILAGALFELKAYCQYCDIVSQIHLAGYEVESYWSKYPWFYFLILALFTEIFAVGVKIKEEQDLTI